MSVVDEICPRCGKFMVKFSHNKKPVCVVCGYRSDSSRGAMRIAPITNTTKEENQTK